MTLCSLHVLVRICFLSARLKAEVIIIWAVTAKVSPENLPITETAALLAILGNLNSSAWIVLFYFIYVVVISAQVP